VDTWIDCPFRYFAQHVLKLEDEAEEEPGLNPRQRGELVHAIFERFYARWADAGHGAITAASLEDARALFAAVAEEALAGVDASDAAIERTRLLGSAVAPAMADRVFDVEVERGLEVEERRLEEKFEGNYSFVAGDGTGRVVAIRGKADRIDLLAGGQLGLVDYKTGRAPARGAVQLPVYAHVAEQRFAGHRGRSWKATAADYIAFRGKPVAHALGRKPEERDKRLREAQAAFVAAVDGIAAGEFPPRPAELRLCTWCPYDAVCRKDYVDLEEAGGDGQS
jgi:RecB family exonuclease